MSELIPQVAGTSYGELSPGGEWFWDGTGKPNDEWIPNPNFTPSTVEAPAQQALPAAKGSLHYVMGRIDAKVFQDHSSKPGPAGVQLTIGLCQCMNPADVIKAFGLTG